MSYSNVSVAKTKDGLKARPSLRAIWAQGGTAVGGWCGIPSALSAEAMARAGFDWVCIDMQHGCMDYATALEMIRAIDATPCQSIVRVPWNEPAMIGRVLDAGADGVIIPMIRTPADAQAAVDACRYPPEGRRSFGPMRVGLRDGASYFSEANGRVLVIPMIETEDALAHVEAIAAIPGVGALFLGPYDMSVALGLPPRDNDGEAAFDHAVATIVAAAKKAGIGAAVLSSATLFAQRAAQGFNMISTTVDLTALSQAARNDLAAARN
ncbi:HpcH/HpaI aldolase family protein [Paraburkholderia oxyphila]|uniref:HpcH/HpaI aldolase family protein n=1 Tax=Paraburkholderia oxyphila TaxID=614212 RepID=UPI0005BADE32|nr:aldolase/citrate lyase family protein [Paraburkholderia oxyphila]